jgi:hypothetical protein
MRFLSIIAAAGAAVAAAVPADSAANEANRPKAVLLEIGKEYTAQELENLQANAPAEPWYQNLTTNGNQLAKRRTTNGFSILSD